MFRATNLEGDDVQAVVRRRRQQVVAPAARWREREVVDRVVDGGERVLPLPPVGALVVPEEGHLRARDRLVVGANGEHGREGSEK